ncbi:hypothetical protein QFZ27_004668 [Inquilinus ginsengisoli]|uniref:hypothetical protein n=1 Tax=Inquilinus ginsengisoli TaxID=363840 RepID=UPI003D202DAF
MAANKFQGCINAVVEALAGKLSADEVSSIVDDIERAAANGDPAGSRTTRLGQAARVLNERDTLAAKMRKRHAILQVQKRKGVQQRIADSGRKATDELDTILSGSVGGTRGAGDSIDARKHALEATWIGGLMHDLRAAGVEARLRNGLLDFGRDVAFERKVAIERAITNGSKVDQATGDKNAWAVGSILAKWDKATRLARNDAGAFIGRIDGYSGYQSHDVVKIRKAGEAVWKQAIREHFDMAKSFPDADAARVDDILHDVFQDIVVGWDAAMDARSMAARLSTRRVLIAKDATHGFAYQEQFGQGGTFEGAFGNIQTAARDVALMERFGPNPQATFDAVIRAEIERAKASGDLTEAARLLEQTKTAGMSPTLADVFDAVSGKANVPGNPTFAHWAQGVRNLQSLSRLGGMTLSALPDIAVRASVLRHNGVGLLEGIADSVTSLARGRGKGELREIADTLGVGIDGVLGNIASRISAADGPPGAAASMLGKLMKVNLAEFWQDSMSTGVGLMLSRNLARRAGDAFDSLPRLLQVNLQRYGIDAAQWDAIRASGVRTVDGQAFLTGEGIADAEMRGRLQTYFVDQAREAMTMPGARERAWTTQFGAPGTLAGEGARFFMQFKQYPMTYLRRHWGRELKRDGIDGFGIAFMIATTTVLGYASMVAKDLAKGREPRDTADPKTWGAAFVQGGGAGIMGDFLFGQYNRFGQGPLETLGGPTVSTASDFVRLLSKLRDGDVDEGTGASAVRFVTNNAPGANLFYTRAALDYLLLWHLQEMLNPGAMRRMERRVERENGQQFWLRPSEAVN